MEIKFKVLKEYDEIPVGRTIIFDDDTSVKSKSAPTTTIMSKNKWFINAIRLMRLLPEYFMEIEPEGKRFDEDWEYTGRVAIPKDGEHFAGVASRGYNGAVWVNCDYDDYENILRKRKTGPTKQEIIKALKRSIRHWLEDILPLVLEGQTDGLPVGTGDCPLCQLFFNQKKDIFECSKCPVDECEADSIYGTFAGNRTPANAMAMICHLQECKDKLEKGNDSI